MKTTIAISIETRNRLNKLGNKDDSYDSIITRLLDGREGGIYKTKRIGNQSIPTTRVKTVKKDMMYWLGQVFSGERKD